MGIFWNGEEVDGITIYGFFTGEKTEELDTPINIWPLSSEFKHSQLSGDNWTVWLCDIRIKEWPEKSAWLNAIERTFEVMIHHGAIVSWAGLEGFFVEPPDLFKPELMSGGVWAIKMRDGRFVCNSRIGESFETLEDSILNRIRSGLGWI